MRKERKRLRMSAMMKLSHRERHLSEGLFDIKLCPGEGFCIVKGCRKSCEPKKVGLCHRHHQHRWRMKSPKRSAYSTLRDHAKARGLKFSISFDYFLGITDGLAYWSGEGVPTIDRVKVERGYEPGNLTVISLSENVSKGNKERHLPAAVQAILERKRARKSGEVENPFSRDEDANPF